MDDYGDLNATDQRATQEVVQAIRLYLERLGREGALICEDCDVETLEALSQAAASEVHAGLRHLWHLRQVVAGREEPDPLDRDVT